MRRTRGFSLIELALGLLILGLLAGGLLPSLGGRHEQESRSAARRQLDTAIEALHGFALVHGRLPCPAPPTLPSNTLGAGLEDCGREHGVLPWVTLAVTETDPWGHRLTYYASAKYTSAGNGGAAGFTLDTEGGADLRDPAGKTLAGSLPAVIVCHGPRGAGAWQSDGLSLPGATGDEAENSDADAMFIDRPNGPEFDDLLAWMPPAVLKARLLAAGRLP